jgi:hypothetical protein
MADTVMSFVIRTAEEERVIGLPDLEIGEHFYDAIGSSVRLQRKQ